ncbi:acyl-CoA dehydrogenase [Phyllosticta citribraziliensis]|uniref:Acyl-CoA dehydrogenase n=1 Tax=Phyllosticta citribraziliensis TaxID=989973 RepID=A0ABR1LNA2_9PEZI
MNRIKSQACSAQRSLECAAADGLQSYKFFKGGVGHRPQLSSRLEGQNRESRTIHARATEYLPDLPDLSESQRAVRGAISKICTRFPDEYWLFTTAIARHGWLGICMPAAYGGSELGLAEAVTMVQTVAESGGGFSATSSIHMNIFGLAPVVKFGVEKQKRRFLPPLIEGKNKDHVDKRSCFAATEPNTGLDTLKLQSTATKTPNGQAYVLRGSKTWTSTAQQASKILILARTTSLSDVEKPSSHGLSLFYTPLDRAAVSIADIPKMGRAAVDSNALHFDGWRGAGSKHILHDMNAERILLADEAVGLGFAALRRASRYAGERVVFGRAVGANQGVQHPLAASWVELEAARMFDEGCQTGEYANAVKWAVVAHCGMGYAKEYHVERYLREVLVPRIAPVSREMCLNYIGERVLGLPKSY